MGGTAELYKGDEFMQTADNTSTINITVDRANIMKDLESIEKELIWLLSIITKCKESVSES